jgi:hypothetical protein
MKMEENKKQTILVSVSGGCVEKEIKDAVVNALSSIKDEINHELLVFDGAFSSRYDQSSSDNRITYFKFNRSLFLKELSQSDIE